MRPGDGELLHFSEDPGIQRFVPHVAATAAQPQPLVWAVDAHHAPSYWFPRQCPRAMAWRTDATSADDAARILGPGGGDRVHGIEYRWLEALRTTRLFAYRLPRAPFSAISPSAHAWVSTEEVWPLGPPEPVGDLLALHEQAGIQLRVLPSLWGFWDAVSASSLGFSGIRLRNATPRPA